MWEVRKCSGVFILCKVIDIYLDGVDNLMVSPASKDILLALMILGQSGTNDIFSCEITSRRERERGLQNADLCYLFVELFQYLKESVVSA